MAFNTVFTNVLMMLCYMIAGYVLVKSKKAESSHAKTLSGILVYICSPCLIISSFQNMEYSIENFKKAMLFFVVSLLIQLLFFLLMFMVFNKKYTDAKYRILTAGGLLGNCGFFGYPLITSLFPKESVVGSYSAVFVASMNLIVFTIGVYLITKDKKYISVKSAIFNPTMFGVAVAIPLYLIQFNFPETVGNTISLLGKMSTPVCMIVLGMRLASMSIKQTFATPFAYVAAALKLVVFPLFALLCVKFLPFLDETFKVSMYVLCATPAAAVILSLAELHGQEQKLAANVVLLSTLISLVTIPLMLLIV